MRIIKKDTIFTLTRGSYSDYETMTVCRANMDIDIDALRWDYLHLFPEQGGHYDFEERKFLTWILEKKVCDELDFSEWYLGEYGDSEFSIRTPDGGVIE